jgi:hypothetical protein
MGKKKKNVDELLKAIRRKCLDCSGNSPTEVELCVIPDCALYPYRISPRCRNYKELDDAGGEDEYSSLQSNQESA